MTPLEEWPDQVELELDNIPDAKFEQIENDEESILPDSKAALDVPDGGFEAWSQVVGSWMLFLYVQSH